MPEVMNYAYMHGPAERHSQSSRVWPRLPNEKDILSEQVLLEQEPNVLQIHGVAKIQRSTLRMRQTGRGGRMGHVVGYIPDLKCTDGFSGGSKRSKNVLKATRSHMET